MRKSIIRLSLPALAVLILILGVSCPSGLLPPMPIRIPESIAGSWDSGCIYDVSDHLYDYSHAVVFDFPADGRLTVTEDFYIKGRTDSEWARDYNRPSRKTQYDAFCHMYSDTEGYLTIFDDKSPEPVIQTDFTLSDSGDKLTLEDIGGRKLELSRLYVE